jgi:hypothetical protein
MAKVSLVALSYLPLLFAIQQQPSDPIVVKIGEPEESELSQLSDVLLGSLGLTGILVLAAILAACVFAGVLFWLRSRES